MTFIHNLYHAAVFAVCCGCVSYMNDQLLADEPMSHPARVLITRGVVPEELPDAREYTGWVDRVTTRDGMQIVSGVFVMCRSNTKWLPKGATDGYAVYLPSLSKDAIFPLLGTYYRVGAVSPGDNGASPGTSVEFRLVEPKDQPKMGLADPHSYIVPIGGACGIHGVMVHASMPSGSNTGGDERVAQLEVLSSASAKQSNWKKTVKVGDVVHVDAVAYRIGNIVHADTDSAVIGWVEFTNMPGK